MNTEGRSTAETIDVFIFGSTRGADGGTDGAARWMEESSLPWNCILTAGPLCCQNHLIGCGFHRKIKFCRVPNCIDAVRETPLTWPSGTCVKQWPGLWYKQCEWRRALLLGYPQTNAIHGSCCINIFYRLSPGDLAHFLGRQRSLLHCIYGAAAL